MYDLITVNAGHSKGSPGASGNGYKEHEVAREIKNRLLSVLKSVGQKCVDTTSDGASKNAVLTEQIFKCNLHSNKGRLDVSIHLNAGGGTGTEVYYYSLKGLAATVSEGISSALGVKNRGAKDGKHLLFLRNTDAPAILVEICFIDNADDMKKLMQKMDAVVDSIVADLTGKTVVRKTETKSDVFYRVICGSFNDKYNAAKRVEELKAKGFDSFVEIK